MNNSDLPVVWEVCRHPEKRGTSRFGLRIRDWSVTRDRNTGHLTGIRVLWRWGPYVPVASLTWRIYSYVESGSVNGYCESRKLNRTVSRELLSPRSELTGAGPVNPSFFHIPASLASFLHHVDCRLGKMRADPVDCPHHPGDWPSSSSHHRASRASQRDYSIAGLQFEELKTVSIKDCAHAHNGGSYIYNKYIVQCSLWTAVSCTVSVVFLVKELHCFLLLFLGELVVPVVGYTFWSN